MHTYMLYISLCTIYLGTVLSYMTLSCSDFQHTCDLRLRVQGCYMPLNDLGCRIHMQQNMVSILTIYSSHRLLEIQQLIEIIVLQSSKSLCTGTITLIIVLVDASQVLEMYASFYNISIYLDTLSHSRPGVVTWNLRNVSRHKKGMDFYTLWYVFCVHIHT